MPVRAMVHVGSRGRRIITHKISIKKPEGRRPLGKRRGRREDNMKVNLTEIKWDAVNRYVWFMDLTSGRNFSTWQ
jgi:hypothetical protein